MAARRCYISVCVVCGEARGLRESPSRCDLGDGGLLGLGARELVVRPSQPDAVQLLGGQRVEVAPAGLVQGTHTGSAEVGDRDTVLGTHRLGPAANLPR